MAENRDGGGDICVAAHNHLSAAQWQLLQALRLYEEGEDYYSVITLAGAAEEIFGRLASKKGLKCALDTLKATLPLISERFFQQELGAGEVSGLGKQSEELVEARGGYAQLRRRIRSGRHA